MKGRTREKSDIWNVEMCVTHELRSFRMDKKPINCQQILQESCYTLS